MMRPTMTDEELELFEQGPEHWGSAYARAERGAALLDRWMPGWADQVSLPSFDISLGCSCVLGQLFADELTEAKNAHEPTIVDITGEDTLTRLSEVSGAPYSFGLRRLGIADEGEIWQPDRFYGFDSEQEGPDYDSLQQAWVPLIEARKAKAGS